MRVFSFLRCFLCFVLTICIAPSSSFESENKKQSAPTSRPRLVRTAKKRGPSERESVTVDLRSDGFIHSPESLVAQSRNMNVERSNGLVFPVLDAVAKSIGVPHRAVGSWSDPPSGRANHAEVADEVLTEEKFQEMRLDNSIWPFDDGDDNDTSAFADPNVTEPAPAPPASPSMAPPPTLAPPQATSLTCTEAPQLGQCDGLSLHLVYTWEECRDACCKYTACEVWQFDGPNGTGYENQCWIGPRNDTSCSGTNVWTHGRRIVSRSGQASQGMDSGKGKGKGKGKGSGDGTGQSNQSNAEANLTGAEAWQAIIAHGRNSQAIGAHNTLSRRQRVEESILRNARTYDANLLRQPH